MKIYVKFDINTLCNKVLTNELTTQGVKFNILSLGEVEFPEGISEEKLKNIAAGLSDYGAQILENQKTVLVQKISQMALIDDRRTRKDVQVCCNAYMPWPSSLM